MCFKAFFWDAILATFSEVVPMSVLNLVFQKYDPNFMAASLDEAYLDITRVCKERGVTSGEVSWFLN